MSARKSRCPPAHYNGQRMSLRELRRQAGRFAIAGFAGHTVPDDLRRLIAEFDLAGVILFARNVLEPRQVADLSREVSALSREWPLWISVDQEGGRVARLKHPFTEWPPAITLGRSGDERLAGRFARALAAELRARRHHARLRSGARRALESGQRGDRRPRAVRRSAGGRAAGRGDRPRRCRRAASPPAASTSPATAIPASTRTMRCRSVEHDLPAPSRPSSSCRFAAPSPKASPRS